MYDKVVNYGETLKTNGSTMTPKELINGLLDTIELLRFKRSLHTNDVRALEQPENTQACLNLITNSIDSQSLVFYTLVYIKLRNPIVREVIDNVIRGM